MLHRFLFFLLTALFLFSVSPAPILSLVNLPINQNKTKNSVYFVDQRKTQYLRVLRKGVLTSSTLATESEGTIRDIDTKGGFAIRPGPKDSLQYKIKLKVMRNDGSIVDHLYSENLLPNTSVVHLANGKEEPSDFASLKTGDKIIIQDTIDLTKSTYPVKTKSKITKI